MLHNRWVGVAGKDMLEDWLLLLVLLKSGVVNIVVGIVVGVV